MYRQGSRTLGAPSKATATTLCQKCLRKGHYSYECTVTAQERPYNARPSRTQQLLNPKLMPALTSDVPNELFQKKGVADEQLAKAADERGRKRQRVDLEDLGDDPDSARRSASASSSISVSTISTRSPSPPKRKSSVPKQRKSSPSRFSPAIKRNRRGHGKDRSRSFSSSSYASDGSVERGPKIFERPRRPKSPRRSLSSDFSKDPTKDVQNRRTRSPIPQRRQMDQKYYANRPRLRSLSPYSKRIALTQAMNG